MWMEAEQSLPRSINVVLASHLLSQADKHKSTVREAGGATWKTGSPLLDKELPRELWKGGSVLGVGSTDPAGHGLSIDIIVHHLLEQSSYRSGEDQQQNVFIVGPPAQATASVQQIYTRLNTRISNDERPQMIVATGHKGEDRKSDAKSLLNPVALLQYLDAAGLIESLSEVSSSIQPSQNTKPRRCILLIQGITHTINALQRRSGLVQAAAMLSSILQAARDIARASHGSCLCLLELDLLWERPNRELRSNAPSALNTAFASPTGRRLRMEVSGVLGRLIDSHVSVLVTVHDGDGRIDARSQDKRIVEVSKDQRLLNGTKNAGRWSIWSW